jgi:hypothetical protein
MLGVYFEPHRFDPQCASDPRQALRALASAASRYLERFEDAVRRGDVGPKNALVTRVRGTGPGVSFGSLVSAVQGTFIREWCCPFEGSHNVRGAPLPIGSALDEARDDGFLFLRFAPQTTDLPLHIHPHSDRFIFVIGGRGFFHVAHEPLTALSSDRIVHLPARDRDALMFRRGLVHTFSTAEHELVLLSYHRPFVPLDEPGQYTCSEPPLAPSAFLDPRSTRVSFDAAWTICGGA